MQEAEPVPNICLTSSKITAKVKIATTVGIMNLRILGRLKLSGMIFIILAINILCFMSLTLQGAFTWRFNPKSTEIPREMTGQEQLNQEMRTHEVTQRTTTVDLKVKFKLDEMKKELNDSILTNDAMFPGKRVGKYLFMDPDLCKRVSHVDIVIIVHTSPGNLEKRQRIRDSFAMESLFLPFHIKHAFLLGKTANKTLERILWMEHVRYNDTVMGDFIDHYHNLSLKGVMGYRWVNEYCGNSRFVLKIDDDVIVNMYKLLYSFLNHMDGKKKSIFCNLWHKNTMPILRKGKWKVEPHVFSHRKTFPYDYCSGFVVILTTDLMGPMFEASLTTPFFWIDDIYLFGMLPTVVGGVTYFNYALDKNMTLIDGLAINCTKTEGPRCPIFATVINSNKYWYYWDLIKGLYSSSSWQVENKIVV